MSDSSQTEESSKGLLYCFVLVVLSVSLVGFFTGTNVKRDQLKHAKTVGPEASERGNIPLARSYRQMRDTPRGPGSGWDEALKVAADQPKLTKSQATLEETLKKRQGRRAYDGAPPTIPHFVQQNSASECLACHDKGLRLGEREAKIIPHAGLTNCNQCHVPETAPAPGQNQIPPDPRGVANSFVGQEPPKSGPRAWSIAPPQIPHSSFMRENCLSCHGSTGSQPMRSSHPQRQNCTQCHASSAETDLRPGTGQGH